MEYRHRHTCANGQVVPATRRQFWQAKFEQNVLRDRRVVRALRREGWRVLTVWECQTSDKEKLGRKLEQFVEAMSDNSK